MQKCREKPILMKCGLEIYLEIAKKNHKMHAVTSLPGRSKLPQLATLTFHGDESSRSALNF